MVTSLLTPLPVLSSRCLSGTLKGYNSHHALREIYFSSDVSLAGTLTLPEGGGTHPAIVVMHSASGGTRSYPFYRHLANNLPEHGIAVFLFDRRGSGESGGNFETADFEMLAADGIAAASKLAGRDDIDAERIGVYGISQGAWLAPIVAARRPSTACAIIVSGSGISPARQMDYTALRALRENGFDESVVRRMLYLRHRIDDYYRGRLSRNEVQGELDAARSARWYSLAYLDDESGLPEDVTQDKWYFEMDYDPLPIWPMVRQPTLFLFGDDDRWVPVDESIATYKTATTDLVEVTFAKIQGADHLMGLESEKDPHISPLYYDLLLDWLRAHLL